MFGDDSDDDEDSFFSTRGFGNFGGFDNAFSSDINMDSSNGAKFFSSSSMTTTVNGVTQTAKKVKSSNGKEKVFISRQAGDKKVSLEKIKDRDGTETTNKKLENVNEDELDDFDKHFEGFGGRGIGMRNFFPSDDMNMAIEGNKKKKKKRK